MLNKETVLISLKLFAITAVSALLLAVVNKITLPVITENNLKAEISAQQEVLPTATNFKNLGIPQIESSDAVIEKISGGITAENNGKISGYVVTAVSHSGYGGDIKVMVGIDSDLRVTKIKILESSETAGLGQNASKPQFSDQFKGADKKLSVVKGVAGDDEISAISSATVTSKAVTACVNAAIEAAQLKSTDNSAGETVQKLEQIKQETEEQIKKGGNNQ